MPGADFGLKVAGRGAEDDLGPIKSTGERFQGAKKMTSCQSLQKDTGKKCRRLEEEPADCGGEEEFRLKRVPGFKPVSGRRRF